MHQGFYVRPSFPVQAESYMMFNFCRCRFKAKKAPQAEREDKTPPAPMSYQAHKSLNLCGDNIDSCVGLVSMTYKMFWTTNFFSCQNRGHSVSYSLDLPLIHYFLCVFFFARESSSNTSKA